METGHPKAVVQSFSLTLCGTCLECIASVKDGHLHLRICDSAASILPGPYLMDAYFLFT